MNLNFDGISKKLVWVSVALLVISMSCFAVQSEDLFMYLAIAREYFKTGAFPAHDPFLYSIPNFSWTIMHQWLGYLAFYGLYVLGDFDFIVIVKTIFIAAVYCFPLWRVRKSPQASFIWGTSVVVALFAMSFRMMERTSFFSDFFIVAVLNILMAEQVKPSRWKYVLPFLFVLWVNLHPGYPLGWFLCGIFLLANLKQYKKPEYLKLVGLVLASVLVCLINPRGIEGFLYPFTFAQNEGKVFREFYFEWMPTFHSLFRNGSQTYFIVGLICLNLILLYRARKTKPVFELISSGFFIFYGLYAIRFVPSMCFALVTLNASLALKAPYPKISFKYLNLGLAILALALVIKNVGWGYDTISGHREFGLGLDARVVPVQAAKLLDESGLKGQVYNSHLFGSYLAWAWEGRRKLIYHGFVTDTNFFLQEYAPFGASPESFERQTEKYDIAAFILDRFTGNEGLLDILAKHPRWQLVYKDEGSLIFLKK